MPDNNPNSDESGEINWDAVVQAVAEALGSYVGGQIGAMAVAAVFKANESSVPSFEKVIADLRESIRQDIENTFIREYAGTVIGYEKDLGTGIRTNNFDTVDRIRSGSQVLIEVLLQYSSMNILVILVRLINIFLLALEIQANTAPEKNEEYRAIRREKAREYANKVKSILNPYAESVRQSLQNACLLRIENAKQAICHNQNGFTYDVKIIFYDDFNRRALTTFEESSCKTFPFNGLDDDDLPSGVERGFTANDKKQHQSFKDCEAFRQREYSNRIRALESFSSPINRAISIWETIT